jgi:hypothetical protein
MQLTHHRSFWAFAIVYAALRELPSIMAAHSASPKHFVCRYLAFAY